MTETQIIPEEENILVVDDALVNLRMLSRILQAEGYQVRTANSGQAALEAVEAAIPSLILLDIIMPHMDGYEVCRTLKSQPHTKDIPIIFISSLDQTEDKLKAFALGGVDYVTKPFQTPEVLARVKAHLTLRHLQQQLENTNLQLEQKVRERTQALIQANERLQAEIQERIKTEEELRRTQERYELAVQGTNDGIWDWDLEQDQIYFSPRWKAILGFEDHELPNSLEEWFNRVHANDLARLRLSILNHVENITPFLEEEYRMYHKDGSLRHVLTRGVAIRNKQGKAYRMAGSQTDISYRKRMEEQLSHDVFYDSLTALPNRSLFLERLKTSLAMNEKRDDYQFAVFLLDINRFKAVNENYGYRLGDLLLAEISWRLKSFIRPIDTLARIGEDEFAIIQENIESLEAVEALANTILQSFAEPFDLEGNELYITLSIGIAISTINPDNLTLVLSSQTKGEQIIRERYQHIDEILRDASIALKRSKAAGESHIEIFRPTMRRRSILRLDLETELRKAIEKEEQIEVHYQPIVMLETGRIAGFEALVRWRHPQRGLIPPFDFLPLAETTDLILSLDCLVLRKACTQIGTWQSVFRTFPLLMLCANISAKHLRQSCLLNCLQQLKKDNRIELSSLHLEITETLLVENIPYATQLLHQIREMGVKVWMDDFGSGYSSLSYLHQLAIDGIKIDRSFVEQLPQNTNSHKTVQIITILAKEMGMGVIAEGIENENSLEALRKLNCRYGQGFLFSQPLPAEEAEKLLRIDIERNGFFAALVNESSLLNG